MAERAGAVMGDAEMLVSLRATSATIAGPESFLCTTVMATETGLK